MCPLRNANCALVPRMLCSSVKSNWISVARYPGTPNLLAWNSSAGQQNLFHHSFSVGDRQPLCAQKNTFHRICSPIRFCDSNTHTRRCAKNHNGFVHFPVMYRLQGLRSLFPNGLRPLRDLPFEDVSHRFSSAVLEQERTSASNFHVCSRRGGNVSFCALSFCFTLMAFSLLPFQR